MALAALMVGLFRDVKGDVRELRRDFEALLTETREAHAQTGKRLDDVHATLLAIVPRAAADPADRS